MLSRCGEILVLGLCDGEQRVAEEVGAVLVREKPMAIAARDCRVARTTFCRLVERVRGTLARLVEAGVDPGELAA